MMGAFFVLEIVHYINLLLTLTLQPINYSVLSETNSHHRVDTI